MSGNFVAQCDRRDITTGDGLPEHGEPAAASASAAAAATSEATTMPAAHHAMYIERRATYSIYFTRFKLAISRCRSVPLSQTPHPRCSCSS